MKMLMLCQTTVKEVEANTTGNCVELKYMKLMRRETDRIELCSQLHEQYSNENLTNPCLSHEIILVHKALQAPVDMPLSG